jgi:cytochrome c553
MRNREGANPKISVTLTAAAGLMAAMILVGTAFTFVSREAAATPQMAKQTGKACGACHKNPKGGGPLK